MNTFLGKDALLFTTVTGDAAHKRHCLIARLDRTVRPHCIMCGGWVMSADVVLVRGPPHQQSDA